MTTLKKGFTLIELLIVIGILAILATTVVLVLNPAQILAETRDTQRLSDFDSIKSAIALWTSTVVPAVGNSAFGTGGVCYTSLVSGATAGTAPTLAECMPTGAGNYSSSTWTLLAVPYTYTAPTGGAGSKLTNGTGWIPIDFTPTSGGSPIPVLPSDPVNTQASGFFYNYFVNGSGQYETDAKLESTKYTARMSVDGGNNNSRYEVGTNVQIVN